MFLLSTNQGNSTIINLVVNIIIFILVFSVSLFFIMRLKNVSKGYKIFFISYIVFWIPLKLLRDYTSIIQKEIDKEIIWLPLMMYGLIGIFIRPLADMLSTKLRNRKIILYMAVIIGIISFIPIIIVQNTATNIIQSLGVGVGASMIGIYELMFKEQYTSNRSFLTVSIMAFPPLIADFASAPIQSIVRMLNLQNQSSSWNLLAILWIIGIVFYAITFVILFFTKEDRMLIGMYHKKEIPINQNNSILFFASLCLVGFLITFVKFSNSGSIATLTIDNLFNKTMPNVSSDVRANLSSYISTAFSLSQLFGTVFLSVFLIKKFNKLIAFSVGIVIWVIYQLVISFNNNPYVYFSLSTLNGFAYGILYNLVLAYVLTLSFRNQKISPMGIYQGVLSIGIMSSSFLIPFLKNLLKNDSASTMINLSLLGGVILLELLFASVYFLDKKIFIKNTENIAE